MSDKLSTVNKLKIGQPMGIAKRMLEANNTANIFDPMTKKERIGLVIDDSISMGHIGMEKAHEAVDAFVKNCNGADTCLALYPLNASKMSLTNQFASVAITAMGIWASGGTPLYTRLQELLKLEPITRAVAFSDGQPTDNTRFSFYNEESSTPDKHTEVIAEYIEKKVPIDTIFIGFGDTTLLKRIADETGGIFLHFTDASVLAKSLKYLTPRYRAMLMDDNTKQKVERGEM